MRIPIGPLLRCPSRCGLRPCRVLDSIGGATPYGGRPALIAYRWTHTPTQGSTHTYTGEVYTPTQGKYTQLHGGSIHAYSPTQGKYTRLHGVSIHTYTREVHRHVTHATPTRGKYS